jgi:hypothetical protein
MGSEPSKLKVRQEYAAWCATPRRLRVQLGLPDSKRGFAELKGINERTLQRWDSLDSHKMLVDQKRKKFAGQADNASISLAIGPPRPETHGNALKKYQTPEGVSLEDDPVWNPELSQDEQRYQQVKDTLVGMAADGHSQAIDMYLKHWGKPFIEAEQSTSGMFPNLSDDDLLERVCRLLGKEVMANFLAKEASVA